MRPDQGILFMKVGVHAQESLEAIVRRKTKEIEEAGFAFWGYGGNTCHPTAMVQPFAKKFEQRGGVIVCMHEMDSRHHAEQVRASHYSVDGRMWEPIPPAINVLGSRYALKIKRLRREEFELPLTNTRVAVGRNRGRRGNLYVYGRVDKACLEIDPEGSSTGEHTIKISLVADLCEPYAVFLKNQ